MTEKVTIRRPLFTLWGLALRVASVIAPGVALHSTALAQDAAPVSASTRAAYDEAQSLMSQKRYADAAGKLARVTAAEPGFAPGWYGLALAARRAANCEVAIPAYRRYAMLRPAEAEPYFGLGLCLRDSGDRPGAIAALRKFIELERRPGQESWIETARSLAATLETTATAGRGAPAYQEAQRLRDRGDIEPALAKFAEAAALEPDLMAARAAWGELLIKIHRDAEAVTVLRAAAERNPRYPLIAYELAFALRETGRFQEAVEAYRAYIQLRPTDPDPHYGLGRALASLGKDDEALRSYRTYVALENRPAEARWVTNARSEIAALERARANRPASPSPGGGPAGAPPASAPAGDRTPAQPR